MRKPQTRPTIHWLRGAAPSGALLLTLATTLILATPASAQATKPTTKPATKPQATKPQATKPQYGKPQQAKPTTQPASQPRSAPGGTTTRPVPPAPQAPPTPTGPQSTKEGKALLAAVLQAMGGAEKFANLKNLTWQGGMVRAGQNVELDIRGVVAFPGENYHMKQSVGASSTTFVVSEGGGWQNSSRTGFSKLPAPFVERFRDSLSIATTPVLRDWKSLVVQQRAPEVVAGMQYDVLRVWRGTAPIDFLVNPDTRLIERKRTRVEDNGTMILREEKTWDYREVDGLMFPFHKTITDNGEQVQIVNMTGYQVNRELPAGFFDAPKAGSSSGEKKQ